MTESAVRAGYRAGKPGLRHRANVDPFHARSAARDTAADLDARVEPSLRPASSTRPPSCRAPSFRRIALALECEVVGPFFDANRERAVAAGAVRLHPFGALHARHDHAPHATHGIGRRFDGLHADAGQRLLVLVGYAAGDGDAARNGDRSRPSFSRPRPVSSTTICRRDSRASRHRPGGPRRSPHCEGRSGRRARCSRRPCPRHARHEREHVAARRRTSVQMRRRDRPLVFVDDRAADAAARGRVERLLHGVGGLHGHGLRAIDAVAGARGAHVVRSRGERPEGEVPFRVGDRVDGRFAASEAPRGSGGDARANDRQLRLHIAHAAADGPAFGQLQIR